VVPSCRTSCLCDGARAVFFLGHARDAGRMIERALLEARVVAGMLGAGSLDSTDVEFALFNRAILHQNEGRVGAAEAAAFELLQISDGKSMHFHAKARLLLGWAMVERAIQESSRSNVRHGFDEQARARASLERINARIGETNALVLAADQHVRLGELDRAESLLADCARTTAVGVQYFEPERCRTYGRISAARGRQADARAWYHQGIALAAAQNANWHMVRLRSALAELG
jgi:hypothetical protein